MMVRGMTAVVPLFIPGHDDRASGIMLAKPVNLYYFSNPASGEVTELAEGARLLSELRPIKLHQGSNPCLSAMMKIYPL